MLHVMPGNILFNSLMALRLNILQISLYRIYIISVTLMLTNTLFLDIRLTTRRIEVPYLGPIVIIYIDVGSAKRRTIMGGTYVFSGVTGLPHGRAWHHLNNQTIWRLLNLQSHKAYILNQHLLGG